MRPRVIDLAVMAAFSGLVSAGEPEPTGGAQLFRTVCATCHGAHGQGKRELFAPPIGGLPAWFVTAQLEKFRSGSRGMAADTAGNAMRSMALALPSVAIPSVASFVETLDKPVPEVQSPAHLPRVASYYLEACAPCHRYNGQGERAFQSAPITSLPAWYLESSLRKFRAGIRGSHPADEPGRKMREVTAHLSDESITELARYITILAERYPPQTRPRNGSVPGQKQQR